MFLFLAVVGFLSVSVTVPLGAVLDGRYLPAEHTTPTTLVTVFRPKPSQEEESPPPTPSSAPSGKGAIETPTSLAVELGGLRKFGSCHIQELGGLRSVGCVEDIYKEGFKISSDSLQFSWASWIALFCYHLTEAKLEEKLIQPTWRTGRDKKQLKFADVIGRDLDAKFVEDGVLTYGEAMFGRGGGAGGAFEIASAQKEVSTGGIHGGVHPSDQEMTVEIDLRFRNRTPGSVPIHLQDLKKAMDVLGKRRLVKGPAPEREKAERTPWNSVLDSSSSEEDSPNSVAALKHPLVGAARRFPDANTEIRAIEIRRKRGLKRFIPKKGKVSKNRLREWWLQVRVALPESEGWAFVWTIIPEGTDGDVFDALCGP